MQELTTREEAKTLSTPHLIEKMLQSADIRIGGGRPWDIQVHNPHVYHAAIACDMLEIGEAYVKGDWDCDRIDQLVEKLNDLDPEMKDSKIRHLVGGFLRLIHDGGSKRWAKKAIHAHYDLDSSLFEAMLDPRMVYSCGYWRDAETLADAQTAKLDLICRKLGLQKGQTLLDIGGGWGGLVIYAAKKYGVKATMVTVSEEQYREATARSEGLPVEVRLQDYRDTPGKFDRIASVGMFEHVGARHYREYMMKARDLLAPNGLFLLHAIGSCQGPHEVNPWIEQNIFPEGHIPTMTEVTHAAEDLFVVEDWHNFGADYDRTLMAWYKNFDGAWPRLKEKFPPEFYRRWRLYLLGCAGAFRVRQLQLWQLVLSVNGIRGGCQRVS